jgi:hypothetical protein
MGDNLPRRSRLGFRTDGKLSPEAEANAEIARLHGRIAELEARTPEKDTA